MRWEIISVSAENHDEQIMHARFWDMPLINATLHSAHGSHPSLKIKVSLEDISTQLGALQSPSSDATTGQQERNVKGSELRCTVNVYQRLPLSIFVDPYELKNYEIGTGNDGVGYTFKYWAVSRDLEVPVMAVSSAFRAQKDSQSPNLSLVHKNGDSALLVTLNELIEAELSSSDELQLGPKAKSETSWDLTIPLHMRYGEPVTDEQNYTKVPGGPRNGNYRPVSLALPNGFLACEGTTPSQPQAVDRVLRDYSPQIRSMFNSARIFPFSQDQGAGSISDFTIWNPIGDGTTTTVSTVEFGTAVVIFGCFVFLVGVFWRTTVRLDVGKHGKVE